MNAFTPADFGLPLSGIQGVTAAGTTIADAYVVAAQITVFSSVPSGTGCVLPSSYAPGSQVTLCNRDGANNLVIYPPLGDQIEALGVNVPSSLAFGGNITLVSFDPPLARHPRTWWETTFFSLGNYLPLTGGTLVGELIINNPSGTSLDVRHNAIIAGTLGVTGATTLSGGGAFTGTFGGNPTLSGNIQVGGTLGVTGATTLSSTIAVTGTSGFTGAATFGVGSGGTGTGLTVNNTLAGKNVSLIPGTTTFDGSGNITHAINVNTNLTGSTTGPGIQNWGYSVVVNADTLSQSAVGSIASDIGTIHNFGGAGFHGGRLGFFASLFQVGAVTGTPGVFENIIAGAQLSVTLNHSFGGSGVTPSTAAGFGTALNPFLAFTSGATNMGGGSGIEVDVLTGTGTSMMDVVGVLVFRYPGSTVQASRDDIGLVIGAPTQTAGQGWHTGLSFGSSGGGFAIDPAGTLIGAAAGVGTKLAAKGIAWSGVTFSTSAIETPGFTVDGSGAITSPSVTNGASVLQLQTGAGALKVGSGVTIANNTVATVLGSLGPTGAHTTVQEWIQIQNSAGTVRYIPCF